jgi:hypothetical protein
MAFYELWLTDDRGVRLAALDNFVAITCGRVVNGIGKFNLQMPASFDDSLLTAPDRMLQVWRQPTGGRLGLWRAYFVRKWKFEMQGSDEVLTVGGLDTNDLLRRRIVAAFAASAQASKTDFADDMMKEIVTQAIADGVAPTPTAGTRVWSNLSIAADLSAGPTISDSFPFKKLLTASGQGVIAGLAKASREAGNEVFFDIVPNVVTSNSITFQFQTFTGQPGQDVTDRVTFDKDKGNLRNASLEYDYEDEENYIYGTGQGEEADRNVQQVYDSTRYSASIWARCEAEADARDQATDNGVIARARSLLESGRPQVRFSAVPMDTQGTRFGRDWDIGYKVKARYRNREFDSIVRAVVISKDGGDAGKEDISARLDYEAVIG